MKEFMLNDKVVVITGGGGLLGKNFCSSIVEAGGKVIIADINEKEGVKLRQKINKEYSRQSAEFCNADITDLKSIKKLIKFAAKRFGKVDALVNCTYPRNKNYGRKFENVAYQDFCKNVNMHLGGYFLASQQFALFFMKQGYGNIINIASVYGVMAPRFGIYEGTKMTTPVEYALVKSAVIQLTKYMAKYLKGYNIRVNCISPGGILNSQPTKFIRKYNSYGATKGMLDAKDLGGTLIFLLSDNSKYLNGQNIIVDDGFSL